MGRLSALRYGAVGFIAACSLTSGAMATYYPDSCGIVFEGFAESSVDAPYIAGPGMVAQASSSGVQDGWNESFSRVTFTECASRRQLDVFLHLDAHAMTAEAAIGEDSLRSSMFMDFLPDGADTLTIEEIRQKASDLGLYFRSNSVSVETCGCNRFFPELREYIPAYEGFK